MPYKSNKDLPIQTAKFSEHEKDIWRNAFNSAYSQYKNEKAAFKVAWAAVEKNRKTSDKIVRNLKRRK